MKQNSRLTISTRFIVKATCYATLALMISGCNRKAESTAESRPVKAVVIQSSASSDSVDFPGEVRARYESRLGFRVGGKIVERMVDVGAVVKRGQPLMRLDPQDAKLSQEQAVAALKAAEATRNLAKADLGRFRELHNQQFISAAAIESKEAAYRSAEATYEQMRAGYKNQENQAGYTILRADNDGVVTAIEAEAGQVVTPGVVVARVARLGEKEIVVSLPENNVDCLKNLSEIKAHVWALSGSTFTGRLRELSPVADPATRTYIARIAITDPTDDIRLGMSAYISIPTKTANADIKIPLASLSHSTDGDAVWVVDGKVARRVPVKVSATAGNDVVISAGLSNGQTIVTAGGAFLREGQKVFPIYDKGSGTMVAEYTEVKQRNPEIANAGALRVAASGLKK